MLPAYNAPAIPAPPATYSAPPVACVVPVAAVVLATIKLPICNASQVLLAKLTVPPAGSGVLANSFQIPAV